MRRTLHAGEDGPAENIRIALDVLGCERIDHGVRLLEDRELTARVVDAGIALTVCPTSNVVIAHLAPDVASHPLDQLRSAGVHVTVNSDDPGMTQVDIAEEYVIVAEAFGYDLEVMEGFSLAAVDASWAPDEDKVALRSRFLAEFDALRAEAGLPLRS